jgi:hypothetical protein
VRRRSKTVLLVALVALTGCGSAGGGNGEDPARGALSKDEYRQLMVAARRVEKAGKAADPSRAVAILREACDSVRDSASELLQSDYTACLGQVGLLDGIVGVPNGERHCKARERQGDLSCVLTPVLVLAQRARIAVDGAQASNRAADARGIAGRCREAVGTPEDDIRAFVRIARAAEAFGRAVRSLDRPRIMPTSRRLQAALRALNDGSSTNPVKLVEACAHS